MRDIYTAYSTVGAQELIEKGYRLRRHSWEKGKYIYKRNGKIYDQDNKEITSNTYWFWEDATIDWEIY